MGEQLTESDVKKIKEEIEYRKIVVRKKELEAVKEARAQGDLSENFEYKAAKQDKNRNESRIRYLERMLKTANIVSDDSKEDEIGINNTVDLYFEDDEEVDKSHVLAGASYDPFDEEEVSPEVQRLRDVVAAMTDRQKQVYQLVLLEERGYTEVAKLLDCSAANVKQICNKVIALIKAGV